MRLPDVVSSLNELQLIEVYLEHANVQNRRDTETVSPESKIQTSWDTAIGFRLSAPNELRIKIDCKLVYKEGSPRPFDLDIGIIGVYRSQSAIDDKKIPDYVQTHSAPLLWPYLREIISNVTMRMTGVALMLPTLSIVFEPSDEASANQTTETLESRDLVSEPTVSQTAKSERRNTPKKLAGTKAESK
ncbi:MAG: protein-export chaperone SecB [Chloroflexi bacterium]|nr:protein-export chaperone SecB [Chloroflexota bacterium]